MIKCDSHCSLYLVVSAYTEVLHLGCWPLVLIVLVEKDKVWLADVKCYLSIASMSRLSLCIAWIESERQQLTAARISRIYHCVQYVDWPLHSSRDAPLASTHALLTPDFSKYSLIKILLCQCRENGFKLDI